MKVQTAERLNSIREYYFSGKLNHIRSMIAGGTDVINLGIGNPDMDPHESVIKELTSSSTLPGSHGYQSYRSIPELRAAFSKWYLSRFGVTLDPDSEILPLIGSKEGIMHISMTFLNRGDAVLLPDPGYPAYAAATKLCGARAIYYNLTPENAWMPDLEEIERMDLSGAKIMWINYPNMPTGARPDSELFSRLISFARAHNLLLVNDNPYGLIQNPEPVSLLSEGLCEHTIELNSLSKSHNMAGWRMGMVAASEENINAILKVKSNMDSGMFLPLQKAAVKALELPASWYNELNEVYSARRALVYRLLTGLGSDYSSSQAGMFVWSKIPSGWNSSYEYSDFLLDEAGIFITPGSIFGTNGRKYIRTSLCVPDDRLQESIERSSKINANR